jgi:hypothetical protein
MPYKYSNYVCSLQKTTYNYSTNAKMTLTNESLHDIDAAEKKFSGTLQAESSKQGIYSVFSAPGQDSPEQWNAHACITWITEDHSNPEISNFDYTQNIKFNAGFALYDTPTSQVPTQIYGNRDSVREFTLVGAVGAVDAAGAADAGDAASMLSLSTAAMVVAANLF